MKFIIAPLLVFALKAQAAGFEIPESDRGQVKTKITEALSAQLGDLQNEKIEVDWRGHCSAIESDFDQPLGVCVYDVSAFMMLAKVAVLRTDNGYVAQPVFVDVD